MTLGWALFWIWLVVEAGLIGFVAGGLWEARH